MAKPRINMTKEEEQRLLILYENGCTCSDVEDFCDENNVSRGVAFHQIAVWNAPECCKECKHVDMFDRMFPCTECSRGKNDMFEKYIERNGK